MDDVSDLERWFVFILTKEEDWWNHSLEQGCSTFEEAKEEAARICRALEKNTCSPETPTMVKIYCPESGEETSGDVVSTETHITWK